MKTGSALLGVVAGIAVGAVVGILFAPDKGTKTRENISKKSQDYLDSFMAKFNDVLDGLTQKLDYVNEKIESGRSKAEDIKKDVKSAMNNP